jgi:tetratricopeptide (TPR) repeat protein
MNPEFLVDQANSQSSCHLRKSQKIRRGKIKMLFYCSRVFKCLFRFLFCKKTRIGIFFFLLLLMGTSTFFAVRYEHFYGRYNTSRTDDLKRIFTAFQRFREHEGRWPACIDEAGATPYNKDLKLGKLHEISSKLPYRCVTLRGYYYPDDSGEKHKVLVTLHKPYQTRLWPLGEMRTEVLLADGSIHHIPPDKIEIKEAILGPALSQKYELDGEYEKALIAYENIYKNSDYYKNSTVRQRYPYDLTYARIYYKQNKRRESFQEYCSHAQWCLDKYFHLSSSDSSLHLSYNGYEERNKALKKIRSAITMDQDYQHMQLTPFLEYQEFLDFMEAEYSKLGSPTEYKETMRLFRDVKNKIVEENPPHSRAFNELEALKNQIREERKRQ